jgi:pimeloyl-ACP methyl ester carboxylesterase
MPPSLSCGATGSGSPAVLQDTRAGADTPEAKANRATLAAKVLAEGAAAAVETFLPKLVGETSHRERPALVAGVRERIRAASPRGIANALHGLAARADSHETLAKIHVPTLVLVGAEDVLTPPDEARAMAAAVPGARLEVIPRAGHLANLENPDAVNAALRLVQARSARTDPRRTVSLGPGRRRSTRRSSSATSRRTRRSCRSSPRSSRTSPRADVRSSPRA